MSKQFFDFRLRRCVHISLYTDTHRELRKTLLEREMSMQEVFQKFSELIVLGDKRAVKMLDELEREKRLGLRVRPTRPVQDAKSVKNIYEIIEQETSSKDKEDDDDDVS